MNHSQATLMWLPHREKVHCHNNYVVAIADDIIHISHTIPTIGATMRQIAITLAHYCLVCDDRPLLAIWGPH